MPTMTIKTNNVPRPLLSFYELTEKQQVEVTDDIGKEHCEDWKGFVFKGQIYNLDDFTIYSKDSEERKQGWDGGMGQSAFHAVVVKLDSSDLDSVVVGQMFC